MKISPLILGGAVLATLTGCDSSSDKDHVVADNTSSSSSAAPSTGAVITVTTDDYTKITLTESTVETFINLILDDPDSPLEEATFSPTLLDETDELSTGCTGGGNVSASGDTITYNQCLIGLGEDQVETHGGLTLKTVEAEGEGVLLADGEYLSNLTTDAYFKLQAIFHPMYIKIDSLETELTGETVHSYRLKANNTGAAGSLIYNDYKIVAKLGDVLTEQRYANYEIAQTRSHNPSFASGYVTFDINGDASIRALNLRHDYTIETLVSFGMNEGVYQGAAKITSGNAVMDIVHLDHTTYSLSLDENGDGFVDHTDTFTMDFTDTISVSFR